MRTLDALDVTGIRKREHWMNVYGAVAHEHSMPLPIFMHPLFTG